MKKRMVLLLVVLLTLTGTGIGVWSMLSSGLKLSVVERYEVEYGEPVLVYKLVKKLNRRQNVALTLTGKGDITEEGQNISFSKAGDYPVTVHAKDGIHSAEAVTTVHVIDEKPPVLTAEDITIVLGETPDYLAHVTAMDEMEGDVKQNVRMDTSQVDLTSPGRYEVVYSARDTAGNTASVTAYLTVGRAPASALSLDENEVWLSGNEYVQLNVSIEPLDWEGTLLWESSDPQICTVNDGFVVWKGEGSCIVTARADHLAAECVVHCEETQLTTIWLNQHSMELNEYQTAKLTNQTYPSNWYGSVSWSSSNPAVARVEDGVVTWVGPGTCTITASAAGVRDECTVTCAGKTWQDQLWDFLLPGRNENSGHDEHGGHDENLDAGHFFE